MSIVNEIITLIQKQVGYTESPVGSNKTKYARFFDVEAWQFFNTKKNPCYWCAVFVIWAIYQVLLPILGSGAAIRNWFGMPAPKNNEAAGCNQFYGYMKKKGWEVAKNKGQAADIIFFNTSAGKCAHVGLIEYVKDGKYHTIEGNKSNMVKRCSYAIGSSEIYAIIHPDYASIEPKPEPDPLPHPTPDVNPVPAPTEKKYVVNVKTYLAVRTLPSANGKKVGELYKGCVVSAIEEKDSWVKITGDSWVYKGYLDEIK